MDERDGFELDVSPTGSRASPRHRGRRAVATGPRATLILTALSLVVLLGAVNLLSGVVLVVVGLISLVAALTLAVTTIRLLGGTARHDDDDGRWEA